MAIQYDLSTVAVGNSIYNPSSTGVVLSTKSLKSVNDYSQTKQGISTANAAMESAFEDDIDVLVGYILDHREDNALEKYEEMMEYWTNSENSTLYSNLNEKEMKTLIKTKVENQSENGESLEELIRDNTSTASGKSWRKTFCNNYKIDKATQEDLLEKMCDIKEEKQVSLGQYILEGIFTVLVVPKLLSEGLDALFGKKHY